MCGDIGEIWGRYRGGMAWFAAARVHAPDDAGMVLEELHAPGRCRGDMWRYGEIQGRCGAVLEEVHAPGDVTEHADS